MATGGLRGDEYRASRLGASTRGSVLWVGGVLLGSEFGVSVGFEGGAGPEKQMWELAQQTALGVTP